MGVAVVPDTVAFEAAGHVDVGDGLDGEFVEGLRGVLATVDVVRVQVGHVDEEPDAGAVDQVVEELPLGHFLAGPGDQRGDVLHREGDGQGRLGGTDVLAQDVQRVPGARNRQQVPRFEKR
jgi:hypothetical protein